MNAREELGENAWVADDCLRTRCMAFRAKELDTCAQRREAAVREFRPRFHDERAAQGEAALRRLPVMPPRAATLDRYLEQHPDDASAGVVLLLGYMAAADDEHLGAARRSPRISLA